MRLGSILACAALAPMLIAAAAPRPPLRLEPSSPWDIDYAENSCRLLRSFGEGRTLTMLSFESAAPGEMDMLVVGKPVSTHEEHVFAKFPPAGNRTQEARIAETVKKGEPALLWSGILLLPDDLRDQMDKAVAAYKATGKGSRFSAELFRKGSAQFEEQATELQIDVRPNHAVVLETGSLTKPMAAMRKCGRDSLKDWGVDPDVQEHVFNSVRVLPGPAWLKWSDYPIKVADQGQESVISVRLLVDAAGKITKCTPLSRFDAEELNEVTCARIVERARLAPAELADGTKVPSYLIQKVTFEIEGNQGNGL